MTTETTAIASPTARIFCIVCNAKPGAPCIDLRTHNPLTEIHGRRQIAADREAAAGQHYASSSAAK